MPLLERPSPSGPPRRGCLSLALAMALGSVVLGGFMVLAASTLLPAVAFAVAAAAILFAMAALHYLVWGRWLGRMIREEQESEPTSGPE
jgi:membrane protein implicated in regulation of membrane protease activity